jgi:hypothetical protein
VERSGKQGDECSLNEVRQPAICFLEKTSSLREAFDAAVLHGDGIDWVQICDK